MAAVFVTNRGQSVDRVAADGGGDVGEPGHVAGRLLEGFEGGEDVRRSVERCQVVI
jgi:hypothetical protein